MPSLYLPHGLGTWLFAMAKRANATHSTATRIANGIATRKGETIFQDTV